MDLSKVGDSNTEMMQNIYPLSCGKIVWGKWDFLKSTLLRYQKAKRPGTSACSKHDSFSRISASSRSSSPSWFYLAAIGSSKDDGYFWPDPLCSDGETWLGCEMRLVSPRYTFITTGTNDTVWDLPASEAKERYRNIIRTVRRKGSAPVLTTVFPITMDPFPTDPQRRVGETNDAIIEVARETGVPVVNYWKAIDALPGKGVWDGLHLSYPPGNPMKASNFSKEGLGWGADTRNLLFLRALHQLDKMVARNSAR